MSAGTPEIPGALAAFQRTFAAALSADAGTLADDPLFAQPGFAVYRNTVAKACIDALVGNFPSITRLVGEDWMRAAAAIHLRASPPSLPMLNVYGEHFPAFLAGFEPARELEYLPAVARLDRFWTEAHLAADAPVLGADALVGQPPEVLARAVLGLHPTTRWAWFDDLPAVTIWRRNHPRLDGDPADAGDALAWRSEGVLIGRPRDRVNALDLDAASCAFLDACGRGAALGDAVQAAFARDPSIDLQRLLARLVEAGAFSALALPADASPADAIHTPACAATPASRAARATEPPQRPHPEEPTR
jgi:hypothetical protein